MVVKVQDNPRDVVSVLIKRHPFLQQARERLIKRICSRLKRLCLKFNEKSGSDYGSSTGKNNSPVNILRSNYNNNEDKYLSTMARLDEEANKVSTYIEGNLWIDASQNNKIKSKQKRECEIFAISMINLFKTPKSLLEIGFNAGHSLSLFLHNFPSIETVLEFDICQHAYVEHNFNLVKTIFPHADIKLTCGDSKETILSAPLPTTIDGTVDIIHIDGGHDYKVSFFLLNGCSFLLVYVRRSLNFYISAMTNIRTNTLTARFPCTLTRRAVDGIF